MRAGAIMDVSFLRNVVGQARRAGAISRDCIITRRPQAIESWVRLMAYDCEKCVLGHVITTTVNVVRCLGLMERLFKFSVRRWFM